MDPSVSVKKYLLCAMVGCAVGLALPACAKQNAAANGDAATSLADAAPPLPVTNAMAPVTDGGYASMPSTMASAINPRLPIPDRLAIEANNRTPDSKPRVEDVFTAFTTKAGAQLTPPEQHMARTYNARYCSGAKTTDGGLAVSVCEYATEAEATKGRDDSEALLKLIKRRNVWRNKTTILAIIETQPTPANDALEKKLVATFQSL